MSNAKDFQKSYRRFMRSAEKRVAEIRKETDAWLEELAIQHFDAVEVHADDGFGPPAEECTVECWHCGDRYSSSEMKRAYRPRMQGAITEAIGNGLRGMTPLWWCRNEDCDGGGFGHDIHPVKARKSRANKEAAE